jgi:hypothetical protein
MSGCPILRALSEGWDQQVPFEIPSGAPLFPPFAKNAKDGAPGHLLGLEEERGTHLGGSVRAPEAATLIEGRHP